MTDERLEGIKKQTEEYSKFFAKASFEEKLWLILRGKLCNGTTDCENSPECPEDSDGCEAQNIVDALMPIIKAEIEGLERRYQHWKGEATRLEKVNKEYEEMLIFCKQDDGTFKPKIVAELTAELGAKNEALLEISKRTVKDYFTGNISILDRENLLTLIGDILSDVGKTALVSMSTTGKELLNEVEMARKIVHPLEFIKLCLLGKENKELLEELERLRKEATIDKRLSHYKTYEDEIAKLKGSLAKAVEGFERYGEHGDSCPWSQIRGGEPRKDGVYRHLVGYGKDEQWIEYKDIKCSCGFDETLKDIGEG